MKVYVTLCLCVYLHEALAESDSDAILENKDVLVLTKSNFERALKQHNQLLVHFYAPLSGQSLGSILEFREAAGALKEAESDVRLGGVDVKKEKDLAASLNVTIMPSLRLYLSGDKNNPVYCPVLKSSTSIITWLKRRKGPSADIISNLTQLDKFIGEDELVVLGLFKDLEEGIVKVFYETAANIADLAFGVTGHDEIFRKYEISGDTVLLIRKSEPDKQFEMGSGTVKNDLVQFIRLYEMELVTEYNGMTASKILNSEVLNHFLLFINKTEEGFEEIYQAFKTTAGKLRGKVLFVMIDVSELRNGRVMEYFRVRSKEAPQVRMVNLSDSAQYQLPSDQFDARTLLEFCLGYLDGKAKPKLQSEPIPENWDTQPVKELVGMNFEKVAFNHNKNVIVLFYAPWSSESRALFPLWEELAEHFSEKDVVVAKIDITANDVNLHLGEKYPSIKLFPAVYSERVVPYSGKRKLKPIVTFIKKEIEKAKTDKAKEEERRKKYLNEQKAAVKEEL
ncbi:protein disulfide-isomerase [Sinocyclocheilus anshuiensis]|uniref:protein disulfide-isomerase n=1 Tax=Sinocyclocheilus anshuiensis TaxID=1608454 RepID=A0A671LMH4_9TELE|nr:PREDICTED: protein disulfide-isomerase-like [Sinocyclocheilus anshuiensis]